MLGDPDPAKARRVMKAEDGQDRERDQAGLMRAPGACAAQFRAISVPSTILLAALLASCGPRVAPLKRADGLRLMVSGDSVQPVLLMSLPASSDVAAQIIFPEHVTARRHGAVEADHLYQFRDRAVDESPQWRRTDNSLEYERELPGPVHMLARVTLESDGVLFHYEFTNRSDVAYDMIDAVTDPRLESVFQDVRLERTYVHHSDGFDLLASETPARLRMPLDQWLPACYLASFTWPVPRRLMWRGNDDVMYYYKSRAVDEPLIATLSKDGQWVIASFTRDAGNVWSNPELTCQHVDPEIALPPHKKGTLEVKMLVLRGSLDDVQRKVLQERASLK
jgi:hypothetical protein